MAQTMESTVPAQGRLVVIPIPADVADADVLDAIESFLADLTGVRHCAAVLTWDDDGSLIAREIEAGGDEQPADPTRRTLRSALGALLAEVFDTGLKASWDAGEPDRPSAGVDDLSMSFLREVHDFVTPKTSFVALLADRVDTGAIVRQLRHIDGLRVIYGGVPPRWAANSA